MAHVVANDLILRQLKCVPAWQRWAMWLLPATTDWVGIQISRVRSCLRRFGIINAAYRGVQDARTAVRYFGKVSAEEKGDKFHVVNCENCHMGPGHRRIPVLTMGTLTITYEDSFWLPMVITSLRP